MGAYRAAVENLGIWNEQEPNGGAERGAAVAVGADGAAAGVFVGASIPDAGPRKGRRRASRMPLRIKP